MLLRAGFLRQAKRTFKKNNKTTRRFFGSSTARTFPALTVIDPLDDIETSVNLHTIGAMNQIEPDGGLVLIAGENVSTAAEKLSKYTGVTGVLTYEDPLLKYVSSEAVSPLIRHVVKSKNLSHVLFSSSAFGKNLLPRTAALLDVAPVSDVQKIESPSKFIRSIYAGNAMSTVECLEPVKLLSVRSTAFPKASLRSDGAAAPIQKLEYKLTEEEASIAQKISFVSKEVQKSERPELNSATKVVSGGRGLKSAENFSIIYELADALGAAVGASRAAVDAGYAPNKMQVGQTGQIVAPELYIAVAISGAIQHLAGMKDSKLIVAINKDGEAPIFQVADYGLVDDLFKVIPELTARIKAASK
eukprot:TRINITY_DN5582_c0_g1_i1.p1 TRINITY_DN5582_c0_g1~~TRINITY_DN5582_c0_g1_i1.p1  ORF type:complete len:359 (-),score=80.83 TRINITY_DN5582_c0_g1_i1:39-1115(-)